MVELLENLVNITNINFEYEERFSVLQTSSAIMSRTVKIDVQHMTMYIHITIHVINI